MKKLLILLIFIFFLSGCGIYNLNSFVLPDDIEFLALVQELNTPEKICQYMADNFVYEPHNILLVPYQLYITKKGDCDDFAIFGIFFANYHNYETYQIALFYKDIRYNHYLAVYKENNKYNFSDNQSYILLEATDFREIANRYNFPLRNIVWLKYIVYDYDMNVVKTVYNN